MIGNAVKVLRPYRAPRPIDGEAGASRATSPALTTVIRAPRDSLPPAGPRR